MAAEIERELGLASELVGGSGGILEVRLDDTVVFSNHRVGGVPDPAVVVKALREAMRVE